VLAADAAASEPAGGLNLCPLSDSGYGFIRLGRIFDNGSAPACMTSIVACCCIIMVEAARM
jgi:hypothetical protein